MDSLLNCIERNEVDDCVLIPIIQESTRLDNTLDLMFTKNRSPIKQQKVFSDISDHDHVEIDINREKNKHKPRPIPLNKKANWDSLRSHNDKTMRLLEKRHFTPKNNG